MYKKNSLKTEAIGAIAALPKRQQAIAIEAYIDVFHPKAWALTEIQRHVLGSPGGSKLRLLEPLYREWLSENDGAWSLAIAALRIPKENWQSPGEWKIVGDVLGVSWETARQTIQALANGRRKGRAIAATILLSGREGDLALCESLKREWIDSIS